MISIVISWVFVVTTLTEYGENQRFRFDYGMLGVVLILSYMYDYFKKDFLNDKALTKGKSNEII
jgi:hypothetical protein